MVNSQIGSWSIATDRNLSKPLLVSQTCYHALANFFQNGSSSLLAVTAESQSHPSGMDSLFAQPWVWAAGGLGNVDECPLQVCLAGGTLRDSLVFASACIVPECTAMDLAADDFPAQIDRASQARIRKQQKQQQQQRLTNPRSNVTSSRNNDSSDFIYNADTVNPTVLVGYTSSFSRLAKINKFLKTGWVCGEYKVPWSIGSTIYIFLLVVLCTLSAMGTLRQRPKKRRLLLSISSSISTSSTSSKVQNDKRNQQHNHHHQQQQRIPSQHAEQISLLQEYEEKKDEISIIPENSMDDTCNRHHHHNTISHSQQLQQSQNQQPPAQSSSWFWDAWDMSIHLQTLCTQRPDTACLDGLKFGSILWVILGHVVAIQSSTGPGYLNPSRFLPPHGFTTTLAGQLFFSARFAVDTFLCISGYLVVHILRRKLVSSSSSSSSASWKRILQILLFRILRILPLYAMCLGFWMFVAPHLGSGPFWYQWQFYLQPCNQYWWTNFLFVNNFLPWERPTTDSCFYHSWYLALDVQLFFLCGPWLVLLYIKSPRAGRRLTAFLWCLSVVVTAFLSYTRKWSVNTLDGGSAVLFDIEGYAKPHVRAQSYLAGMYIAMMPSSVSNKGKEGLLKTTQLQQQHQRTSIKALLASLCGLLTMSLITVTGAYSRRACQFQEVPSISDCGSSWDPMATFLYTAFARAIWSICIAILIRLCLERRGGLVGSILSWNIWTPLAHLSFGVYLIHPMIIFIWKLGDREKMTFRVFSYLMDFTSITVVSFVFALLATLTVEFPFCALMKPLTQKSRTSMRLRQTENDDDKLLVSDLEHIPIKRQHPNSYGTHNI